jgi:hypothetical protein
VSCASLRGLDAYLTTPPECLEVHGSTTIEVERPVPLITSESDLAWRVISVEVEVSGGVVAGATLVGSMTRVVLSPEEERRAIERVEDHYDPDDHYSDESADEDRCERRRELWEALSQ